MASKRIGVSLPKYVIELCGIDQVENKSGRIQELMMKGLISEKQENNPPSRFQTGEFVAIPESFLAFS